MSEHVFKCPECGAPLAVTRFARHANCKFCGAKVAVDPSVVSAAKYQAAYREWVTPDRARYPETWGLAGRAWAPRAHLASGDRFSIYLVDEARSPTRRVVARVAKRPEDDVVLARTRTLLATLRQGDDLGAIQLAALLPHPVALGAIQGGPHAGRAALLTMFRSTFRYSLADVHSTFPGGVDPPVGMWAWRRILEGLGALHRAGFAHAAIVPTHVLLEDRDHGAMLVGWSRLTPLGAPRPALPPAPSAFERGLPPRASVELDVALSARAVSHALGGDGSGDVPARVPRPFAEILARAARAELAPADADAQQLSASLRKVARASFGPPSFHPLRMPG